MKIGLAIRCARRRKGWSQQELADRANMTRQHVDRHEHGGLEPKIAVLKRYADALGMPAWRLLKFAETRTEVV